MKAVVFVIAGILAAAARGGDAGSWNPLFNGSDLSGWKTPADVAWAWKVEDGVIRGITDEKAHGRDLWSEREFGDFVLELDWRFPDPPVKKMLKIILPNGDDALNPDGTRKKEEVLFGGDSGATRQPTEVIPKKCSPNAI
ncbi:MAG: DUF1080 domain-containing protein, partial [Verrucomicrobiae bacterium]|nr:DUF1080 domain-containing protein [Verrucomicrobiae bacterium]